MDRGGGGGQGNGTSWQGDVGGHLLVLCGLDGHGGLLGVGLLQVFHNEADWVIWLLYQEPLHDLVLEGCGIR